MKRLGEGGSFFPVDDIIHVLSFCLKTNKLLVKLWVRPSLLSLPIWLWKMLKKGPVPLYRLNPFSKSDILMMLFLCYLEMNQNPFYCIKIHIALYEFKCNLWEVI